MSDPESPGAIVGRMLRAAQENQSEDMPAVGSYAMEYAGQIAGLITPENVDAFMYGTALINILVQEAILRLHMVSIECANTAETEAEMGFVEGTGSAATSIAKLIGAAVDEVVRTAAEQQHFDRSFNDIIADM